MSTENVVEFIPLLEYENDYEILNKYPFTIRRKDNHKEISEWIDTDEYVKVYINGKDKRKHALIAKQFIHNDDPEHKTEVDHINRNRKDYHIDNLCWITPSNNQRNKASHCGVLYEFIDEIPNDYIDVTSYDTKTETHEFEDKEYYYSPSTDRFYYNGKQYRILNINSARGALNVSMTDKNKRKVHAYYTRFKIQYDLLD